MEEQSIGAQPSKNRVLYLNHILICEIDEFSIEKHVRSKWNILSIILKNFQVTTELTQIFEQISNPNPKNPEHIALVDMETNHAYVVNMWMTSWMTSGYTKGVLQFSGPQDLKENPLWLKKIRLMAFW